MKTVTLDILDDKALNLLRDLEALHIIRIQSNDEGSNSRSLNLAAKYSGKMTKQSTEEINKQLDDLRNEWD